jgi:hypothetical protein
VWYFYTGEKQNVCSDGVKTCSYHMKVSKCWSPATVNVSFQVKIQHNYVVRV